MARVDIVMPQMGESIAEGTLSKWLKKVGDPVKRDEPIFEISTDKVDAEIPAPSSGVLAEILVTEGQTVAVSTVVARLETEVGAAIPAAAPGSPKSEPAKAAVPGAPAKAAAATVGAALLPPSAASSAVKHGPSGGNGNSLEDRLRTKSSPLVRKIAAEHGVQLTGMRGSGIAGRVTKKDIMQFLESGGSAAATRPSMYAPAGLDYQAPTVEPWPGDVVEPMSKIRQLTSDHMVVA
ncbi:MAG: biotin/lipoyl-containing protein, partial [Gemmatimonadaceae bacterium]